MRPGGHQTLRACDVFGPHLLAIDRRRPTHALVVPVPELGGDLVEADGEGEGTDEDGGDEHRVAPEEEVVDLLLQSKVHSQVAITIPKQAFHTYPAVHHVPDPAVITIVPRASLHIVARAQVVAELTFDIREQQKRSNRKLSERWEAFEAV